MPAITPPEVEAAARVIYRDAERRENYYTSAHRGAWEKVARSALEAAADARRDTGESAVLAAVRALHQPYTPPGLFGSGLVRYTYCTSCNSVAGWPCPTAAELDKAGS